MIAIDLKALRQSAPADQAALGLRVGVHACTVSRWEQASTAPPRHATRLQELADSPPPHAAQRPPPSPRRRHKNRPRSATAPPCSAKPPPQPRARHPAAQRPQRPARRSPSDPAKCPSPTVSASTCTTVNLRTSSRR